MSGGVEKGLPTRVRAGELADNRECAEPAIMSRWIWSSTVLLLTVGGNEAAGVDFTFAIWSDTHFGAYDGGGYRDNSAGDIASLAGTPYPPQIGGTVGPIEFVLVTGDITDNTAFMQYQDNDGMTDDDFISCINRWFTMPVYEITGNHDSYNEPGATQIRAAIANRHGGTSYSFGHQGVHFIGLDGWTSSDEPFHTSALPFLEAHMPLVPAQQPVVIFSHYTPRDPPHSQWDRFFNAVQGHNIILMCHGHEHYPRVGGWRGYDYLVTSDCKVVHGNQAFSVVRIRGAQLVGIGYDWYNNAWRTDALINKPITGTGPHIIVEPVALAASTTWSISPPADHFVVRNGGGGTLNYEVMAHAAWIGVQPTSGSSSGEYDDISVIYNVGGLLPGDYEATIEVRDPLAFNSPVSVDVQLQIRPVPGDLDVDFDVDQEDFGRFQACVSGAGIAQHASQCAGARLDSDDDVDAGDVAIFRRCLSGPNVTADPTCAQ